MTLAFKAMPAPDWAEATTITIPAVPTHTSEEWAQAVFDVRNVPAPVLAMFWLRERIVGLLGIARDAPTPLPSTRSPTARPSSKRTRNTYDSSPRFRPTTTPASCTSSPPWS